MLFAIALIDASIIGAAAVGLSTSYAVADVLGLRHSLHRRPSEAKAFYAIFGGLLLVAAVIVIIPGSPLGLLTEGVQTLAGVLLPSATVFLLLLCNDRAVLGPWVNGARLQRVHRRGRRGAGDAVDRADRRRCCSHRSAPAQIVAHPRDRHRCSALAAGAVTVAGPPPVPDPPVALPHAVDRASWRMPPLALLDRPALSGSRRLGLTVLRGYLVIASALVVVRVVQLALGH